jgi:Flp pilus assembly protein TadD
LSNRLRVVGWLLFASTVLGCSPPPPGPARPPNPDSGSEQWVYALGQLAEEDDNDARRGLERAYQLGQRDALFLRDLAEVRLATGDRAGAAEVARAGLEEVDRMPSTAQFQDEDRRIFQALLGSLQAAAVDDVPTLERLAAEARPRLADPWYLLGWALESRGAKAEARAAYQAYLDRSPEFDLLRRSMGMRRHAREVTAAS